MSEEMGAVLFQTLEDAQQAAEEFGAYAVWKVRGNVFAPAPTGDIWSNESGQWLKVPKDFRCSEHDERLMTSKHANIVCISAPFGGIGGIAPDVHPLNRQGPAQEAQCSRHLMHTNGP